MKYKTINYFIAMVWIVNGIYCKVLGYVPRHEQIVSRILGTDYSVGLTRTIGVLEVFMAVWVVSNYRSKLNAIIQILIIGTMNVLEFLIVPDLLLWGKFNALFALMFMALIYYNEFLLHRKNLTE